MGDAPLGAVLVEGGGENVMLPRLPMELPPPSRASAAIGASARQIAAVAARRREPREDIFLITLLRFYLCQVCRVRPATSMIWCNTRFLARGLQAPAIVIASILMVGESVPRRNTRSFAGVRLANISVRCPAIVISATGSANSPSRIRNPAAPRL